MDIVKQITVLLWILGAVLLTPVVLRHFDIDAVAAARRILLVEKQEDTAAPDVSAPQTRPEFQRQAIDPEMLRSLFRKTDKTAAAEWTVQEEPETPEPQEAEIGELIIGLERVAATVAAEQPNAREARTFGVPPVFHAGKEADKKVRWIPPPPGFSTAETFNYLIYRQTQPVGENLKKVLDAIHGNLMLDLTPFTLVAKPNRILVILFGDKNSYSSFTRQPAWSGAAADLKADTMYVLEGKNFYPLSVHELTHLYFDGYFLPSVSPLWLSEGMAVYMQLYATRQKPGWIERSLRSLAAGKAFDLEQMAQMETLASLPDDQAELWYTQAYSLIDYLLNARSRDEFYRFCSELKNGTPVYQALYRAYGMPFNRLSVLQNVWMHDLVKKLRAEDAAAAKAAAENAARTAVSTQAVVGPLRPAAAKPAVQNSGKTIIKPLKKVETHAYRGGF